MDDHLITSVADIPDEEAARTFLEEQYGLDPDGVLAKEILARTSKSREAAAGKIRADQVQSQKDLAHEVMVPILRKRFAAGYMLAAKAFGFTQLVNQLMAADFMRRVDMLSELWLDPPGTSDEHTLTFGVFSQEAVLECGYGVLAHPPSGFKGMPGVESERDPELSAEAYRPHQHGFSVRDDVIKHCLPIPFSCKPILRVERDRIYLRLDSGILVEKAPDSSQQGENRVMYNPAQAFQGVFGYDIDIWEVVNPRLGVTIAQQAICELVGLHRKNLWFTPNPACSAEEWESYANQCSSRPLASIQFSRYAPARHEQDRMARVREILRHEAASGKHADLGIPRAALLTAESAVV